MKESGLQGYTVEEDSVDCQHATQIVSATRGTRGAVEHRSTILG
jgi:hypothetical protein